MKRAIILLTLTLCAAFSIAADADYTTSEEYISLRKNMHDAFNNADSASFFPALRNFEDYLLKHGDIHGYYTQRCNEIVFQMNQQKIFEAYKLARELSEELREKHIDKEIYMAHNMLGHINSFCGNKEEAKENWREALRLMEQEGYYANMPPIYMNIVNVANDDDLEETDSLLAKALEISKKYSPERVFDIETRQTLSYYYRGDWDRFVEGYKAYKEGEKEGKTSVHGRSLEVYYLAYQGKTDEAIALAKEELGDEGKAAIVQIYEKAGRWQEAYHSQKEASATNDSIINVVLANSMMGIRDEIRIYEADRKAFRSKFLGLSGVLLLLLLLILTLVYLFHTRRKHLKELKAAYDHALESDKMKTAFIQNVSHEVRTPLNIISGFSQVIADPDLTESVEERQHMASMMQKSAQQITTLIDEIIGLSLIETTEKMHQDDEAHVNKVLREVVKDYEKQVKKKTKLQLESDLDDDFTLQTNTNMFKRIVSALTDNATKYTEKGSITIKAHADEETLTIAVEDTGCGIPEKEAENIFGRFVKLDSFKEGIGLGLPLSRKLAEQLGGNVILDTTYHDGARFVVTLPIT
ncbi:MAG: HAMP domain-containing histidine kinase [Prevotella sp.]|nr:HAMP domain-containing histidine kinase [Prevotella sp.]